VPALLAPCPEFVCCKPVGGFFILRAPRLRGSNFTSIFPFVAASISISPEAKSALNDAETGISRYWEYSPVRTPAGNVFYTRPVNSLTAGLSQWRFDPVPLCTHEE
jgi:hypothetical protein